MSRNNRRYYGKKKKKVPQSQPKPNNKLQRITALSEELMGLLIDSIEEIEGGKIATKVDKQTVRFAEVIVKHAASMETCPYCLVVKHTDDCIVTEATNLLGGNSQENAVGEKTTGD